MNTKEIFTDIYNKNLWKSNESVSGTGSEIIQTHVLIANLNRLLKELNIKSILDIPCGDFNWMREVDLSGIDYIGADIVQELINENIKKFKEFKFTTLNLITDSLPQSDMIIVRDCFVHFSYSDIISSIKNIKQSNSKYLLTTTFTDYQKNRDIETGQWRQVNLQKEPFFFPEPMILINENCTERNGAYMDKSIALYLINEIK